MKPILSISYYMFATQFQTEEMAKVTLQKIRDLGFEYLDIVPLYMQKHPMFAGTPFDIEATYDWPQLLKEADLKVSTIFDLYEVLAKDPEKAISMADIYGTNKIVAGLSKTIDFSSTDSVAAYANGLNRLGQVFRAAGKEFSFHNHSLEFSKVAGTNKTALEVLLKETNPEVVKFAFDPAWAQFSGASPEAYLRKAKDSINILHLSDCGIAIDSPQVMPNQNFERELGCGNMELYDLMNTARGYGVDLFVLEMHSNFIHNDPFESAKISMEYLNAYFSN